MSNVENIQSSSVESGRPWKIIMALGVLTLILGIILVFNVTATALAITLLVGISLIIAGIGRISGSHHARHRLLAVVIGVIGILLGVLAIVMPSLTLAALAFLVGVGFLISGAVNLVLGLQASGTKDRSWLLLSAVLDFVAGVLALAWPTLTVFLVCLIFGIRVIIAGASDIAYALALHRDARANPTPPSGAVPA